jgi:chromosome segregation ATPase
MRPHHLALLIPLLAPAAGAEGLYKWTDERGVVHYSDFPPPTEQKSGVSKLNKQGILLRKGESEADKQAHEAELAKQKQAQELRAEQTRYDRALQERYRTTADITAETDKQIKVLQTGLRTLESQLRMASAQLADLNNEANKLRSSGKSISQGLSSQLQEKQRLQNETLGLIQSRRAEIERLRIKAAQDILRFQELNKPVSAQ